MNKVLKVYLISNVVNKNNEEVNYKDVYKLLWDIQKETRIVKNKAVQLCWEWYGFSSDYYYKNKSNPDTIEFLGYTGSHALPNYISKSLKDYVEFGCSANIGTSIEDVASHYKNDKNDIIDGKKSITEYKTNQPIDLRNDSIRINYDKNEFNVNLSLVNRNKSKELGIDKFNFKCVVKDNSTRTILERCYDGIYKICGSKLIYDKKKKMWKLNLCYKFESEKNNDLDENKILGVDIGVVKPIVASVYGDWNRLSIDGNELISFRQRVEQRRISLLRQTKFSGDGKIGHGRHTRCKSIDKLSDKINNFRNSTNNKYSRALIDFAVKNNCGTIQMENLEGFDKESVFLQKNWSYFELQNMIQNKAAEKGIKVIKIDPKFTSQRCSKCGCINKDNRKTQATFECTSCGFKTNADYNASQNIAIRDIDKIIAKEIKSK